MAESVVALRSDWTTPFYRFLSLPWLAARSIRDNQACPRSEKLSPNYNRLRSFLISAFRRTHPNLLAFGNKRRHLHYQPGLQLGRLGDVRDAGAFHARFGLDHGENNRRRQFHADGLALMKFHLHLELRHQVAG